MRLVLIALPLIALSIPAAAQIAAPKRKPGYWEMTMTMQSPKPMTNKSLFCTDAAMEQKMSALGQQQGPGQNCSKPVITRGPGGLSFDSTCQMAGHTTHTKGTATGDFQSSYRLVMVSEMTPPMPGMANPSRMQIDSKWLGPCPAGKKPGDMTMPNGMTINIGSIGR